MRYTKLFETWERGKRFVMYADKLIRTYAALLMMNTHVLHTYTEQAVPFIPC